MAPNFETLVFGLEAPCLVALDTLWFPCWFEAVGSDGAGF